MSGNKTEASHLKELSDSTPENDKDCEEISKKCSSDTNATLENVEASKKHIEEKINENETNTEDECETENGIDSVVETGQKKPASENGTSAENICDDLDSDSGNKNSNAESTSKESDNVNEDSISKETSDITTRTTGQDIGTRNAEENEPNANRNLNDEINRSKITEESENKPNENKSLKNGINSREIAEERNYESIENRNLNSGINYNNPKKVAVAVAAASDDDADDQAKKALKKFGLFALKTAVISGAILGGTALIVPAIGFGSLGVTGGSLAAAYQSSVLGGTIASGSAFATLQSIGMAGLSAATNGVVVAGSAAVSAAHTFGKSEKK